MFFIFHLSRLLEARDATTILASVRVPGTSTVTKIQSPTFLR